MTNKKEKELEAARNMMQHAIANYCKVKEVEDCVAVITATESKIERQIHQESRVRGLDELIQSSDGPVDSSKFFNMASSWSWNLNIAEIARELEKAGFDPEEEYWDYYEELFVLFFSNTESQGKENKQNWETIGYILSEFCSTGIHL
jgi:hypothetical protein